MGATELLGNSRDELMSALGGKRTYAKRRPLLRKCSLAGQANIELLRDALVGCGPQADPGEPGLQPRAAFRDRLIDPAQCIDVAVEADVGDREASTRKPLAILDEPIDPLHAFPAAFLHPLGRLWKAVRPLPKDFQPL